jgi:hypothetical protein
MQKITFTFSFILLFIFSNCFAQEKTCTKSHCLKGDVGYVSFSIGPSIPLGNFSSNDINNPNSGFANTGSKVEINGGYNVFKSTDLAVKLFYSMNNFDASSLTKKLTADNPGTTWTTSGRSWDLVGFMVGLNYSYPFRNKFVGDMKFQTGLMKSSTPQMTVTGSNGAIITEGEKSASSFVYLISVGGHYPLGRLIDGVASLEYLSSSASFDNINKVSSTPGYTPVTSTSSFKQSISILSLNFGVRVKF